MDQSTALSLLKAGKNVYLTGSAGTGKTYVINQFIEYLREREVPLAVTASTGIAATHIGGQTIHSWSGVGIKDTIGPKDLERIGKNRQTVTRIKAVRVLIIDEISMLSGKVLSAISEILKHFRKNSEAFGGVQIILSGDFYQLPPVSREIVSNREKFAFMAPVWVEAGLKICYLTQQFRQGRDTLSFILDEIRSQDISDDSLERLREKLEDETKLPDAIKLFTHNADVDSMNASKLKENPNRSKAFYAETQGQSNILESLKMSVLASPELELKEGAQVMFVKNNPDKGYFNGSTGIISRFEDEEGYPVVELLDGNEIIASPEEWMVTDENETILASFKQVPLRLAWAITVHKSQGMTLSQATLDLSKTFEAGQGYVALSRLKSWDGLVLEGINRISLELDPLAVKADKRFQELSEESEDWINIHDDKSLEKIHLQYIEKCGGTNDPEVIALNKNRAKKYYKKEKKESTYKKTLELIKLGKSLAEIAMERELSEGTIVGHLERIKQDDPEIDFTRFKPSEKDIQKVQKVIQKIKSQNQEEYYDKEGNVRIGIIHKALNGVIDYETIRLVKLFMV
ncbi:MAG: helix-turn-helix domain-containing protein [Cyclobacteriaceae bacterium]